MLLAQAIDVPIAPDITRFYLTPMHSRFDADCLYTRHVPEPWCYHLEDALASYRRCNPLLLDGSFSPRMQLADILNLTADGWSGAVPAEIFFSFLCQCKHPFTTSSITLNILCLFDFIVWDPFFSFCKDYDECAMLLVAFTRNLCIPIDSY